MFNSKKRFVFALGTGRCGLRSVGYLFHRQSGSNSTHMELPLLEWKHGAPDDWYRNRILARMNRMRQSRNEDVLCDCASFYLPFVEYAMQAESDVRCVCMQRSREKTILSFQRWLDRVQPLPTNHWSMNLPAGWYRDLVLSRLYPKYDEPDREKAIGMYYDEYYKKAQTLAQRFPDRFRLFELERTLNTPDGQSELLSFCGFDLDQQARIQGIREHETDSQPFSNGPSKFATRPEDPRRCVVLVPYSGHIVPGCEDALRELERRGYLVRRIGGYAAIDQGRNQMATDALAEGFEETMWIDSDVVFDPNAVDQLRSHQVPVSSAIYPQKGKLALACHVMPGSTKMVFGQQGSLQEILYAATGFLHVRRHVYETLQSELNLAVCNERFGRPMIPFFAPMVHPIDEGHWYLAEDYAFSERLRQCGIKIYADTTIRLWHVGSYSYSWEDAGTEPTRFENFTLNFTNRPGENEGHLPFEPSPENDVPNNEQSPY